MISFVHIGILLGFLKIGESLATEDGSIFTMYCQAPLFLIVNNKLNLSLIIRKEYPLVVHHRPLYITTYRKRMFLVELYTNPILEVTKYSKCKLGMTKRRLSKLLYLIHRYKKNFINFKLDFFYRWRLDRFKKVWFKFTWLIDYKTSLIYFFFRRIIFFIANYIAPCLSSFGLGDVFGLFFSILVAGMLYDLLTKGTINSKSALLTPLFVVCPSFTILDPEVAAQAARAAMAERARELWAQVIAHPSGIGMRDAWPDGDPRGRGLNEAEAGPSTTEDTAEQAEAGPSTTEDTTEYTAEQAEAGPSTTEDTTEYTAEVSEASPTTADKGKGRAHK